MVCRFYIPECLNPAKLANMYLSLGQVDWKSWTSNNSSWLQNCFKPIVVQYSGYWFAFKRSRTFINCWPWEKTQHTEREIDGRKKSIIIRGHHFLQSYILLLDFNECFWNFASYLVIIDYEAYETEIFLIHNQKRITEDFHWSDRSYCWRNLSTHLL